MDSRARALSTFRLTLSDTPGHPQTGAGRYPEQREGEREPNRKRIPSENYCGQQADQITGLLPAVFFRTIQEKKEISRKYRGIPTPADIHGTSPL